LTIVLAAIGFNSWNELRFEQLAGARTEVGVALAPAPEKP
jgi:hypothetical protein